MFERSFGEKRWKAPANIRSYLVCVFLVVHTKYLRLTTLARNIFCIPILRTPSERILRTAGNICTKKRATFAGDCVNMHKILHKN